MPRDYVNFEVEDRIALVTVDRPPVNALNLQVLREMKEAFLELGERKDVAAVIVTGGGDAFMAGADIKMVSEMGPDDAVELSRRIGDVFDEIVRFEGAVIAAVSGLALGGGCEVALACDIRVADEGAIFGLPEVGLGLMPGAGGTQRLPRLVGSGKAKEMIFTGDPITAEEARNIGLVERVAPRGEAVSEAGRLAKRILLRGPVAVAHAKRAINEGVDMDLREGLKREAMLFSQLFKTVDKREGVAAFIEKRKPAFIGK